MQGEHLPVRGLLAGNIYQDDLSVGEGRPVAVSLVVGYAKIFSLQPHASKPVALKCQSTLDLNMIV